MNYYNFPFLFNKSNSSVINDEFDATYIPNISSVADGTYSANSISSEFDNAIGTKSGSSIVANDGSQWTLKSKRKSRDQEVTVDMVSIGTIFLRVNDTGKAYFCFYDKNVQRLMIGVTNNANDYGPSPFDLQDKYYFYSEYMDTINNYTDITFGVEGFDLYAKFDGVELIRVKARVHLESGYAGIKPYLGISIFTFKTFERISVYSDTDNNIINIKDFGARGLQTTGTIASGSQTLTVASASGFKIGDLIIVENGVGEAIGGKWPYLSYTDLAAMNADTLQYDGRKAYLQTDDLVYRSENGVWSLWGFTVYVAGAVSIANFYHSKAIPISHHTAITNIVGNVITLQDAAIGNGTNANVYLDNTAVITDLCSNKDGGLAPYDKDNGVIYIPEERFAIGSRIHGKRTNFTLKGGGKYTSTLFSPKGVSSADFVGDNTDGITLKDFGLIGNANGSGGFGFPWKVFHNDDFPMGDEDHYYFPHGILLVNVSDALIENIYVKNVFQHAAGLSMCTNCTVRNCIGESTEGDYIYLSWKFQSADGSYNTFDGNHFECPKLTPAYESFGDSFCTFNNCTSTNGYMSLNSASDFTFQDCQQVTTENSRAHNNWGNPNAPLINVNNNIGRGGALGSIINQQMTIGGFLDGVRDQSPGIIINAENAGINITGGFYHGKDADLTNPPTFWGGPNAIISTGIGTIVDGFVATGVINGTTTLYNSNIGVTDGEVKNTTAAKIAISSTVVTSNNIGTETIV
jgi:hypothetical protein